MDACHNSCTHGSSVIPGCSHSPQHIVCNYSNCHSCGSPLQFAKVCGRRSRNQPRTISMRLSITGLQNLIRETENTIDLDIWQHCDVVIFSGLEFVDGQWKLAEQAEAIAPFLLEVRRRHPFVKLYWSAGGFAMAMENALKSPEFWASLEQCIQQRQFDGVDLNLEMVTSYPDSFLQSVLGFCFRQQTMVTLPNNLKILNHVGPQLYKELSELVLRVNVNSYGFLKFGPEMVTEHGKYSSMLPAFESGLEDFKKTVEWLTQAGLQEYKITGGMDTSALQYNLNAEEDLVKSISLVTARDIESKKIGGEMVGHRRLHYTEKFDETQMASMLELKKARVAISYDNYRVRNAKLNFLKKMGGAVLGDIYYDLPLAHRHSLLRMAHSKLAPRGEAPHPNPEETEDLPTVPEETVEEEEDEEDESVRQSVIELSSTLIRSTARHAI